MKDLGRQPLFQLIAAVIVLLAAEWRPMAGLIAALLWIAWVAAASESGSSSRLFTTH